jgi:hypothetical protein
MHAFSKPFFQSPRIIIKTLCVRDATMVESKAPREFAD